VMPYLRESGAKLPYYGEVGLDNLPTGMLEWSRYKMATEDVQMQKLEQAITMSSNAQVAGIDVGSVSPLSAVAGSEDLAELTKLRKTKGSWEDFKVYFGERYLPKLVEMKKLATGQRVVNLTVAVVTHSNFMKDSKEATEVQDNCGFAWADTPGGKPLNNQAVSLEGSVYSIDEIMGEGYTLTSSRVRRSLNEVHPKKCDEVAPGNSYNPKQTVDQGGNPLMCMRDIGDMCYQSQAASMPDTIEGKLKKYVSVISKGEGSGRVSDYWKSKIAEAGKRTIETAGEDDSELQEEQLIQFATGLKCVDGGPPDYDFTKELAAARHASRSNLVQPTSEVDGDHLDVVMGDIY